MSEFQDSIGIRAAPAEVFSFVASVSNLPAFLPFIRQVRPESGDHVVALRGPEAQQREVNGFFRVNQETSRIDWGTDGTPSYRGWLEVRDAGSGESELIVHLSLERHDRDSVRQSLRQVLEAIRRMVEHRGGRVAGGGAA